jgi:hypothetical protein
MWHSNGAPYYLARQIRRMGSSLLVSKSAENIRELVQISRLLSQLCGRYHTAMRSSIDGLPLFHKQELDGIKGTLAVCEREMEKLHLAAACAEEMLADAYEALRVEPPLRPYTIVADADQGQPHHLVENGKK